ncbi:hypothetical protein Nepgr_028337 [Nepenthes gracilis]|uniref:Uncharacterized protein n=1 Tax=Nepenthes gracilis TaxID=150966 RepID=A0AAD3TCN2_NEPGR|nr:hypothetical protein Nepgr_028337 [Nepenthes gracilis]
MLCSASAGIERCHFAIDCGWPSRNHRSEIFFPLACYTESSLSRFLLNRRRQFFCSISFASRWGVFVALIISSWASVLSVSDAWAKKSGSLLIRECHFVQIRPDPDAPQVNKLCVACVALQDAPSLLMIEVSIKEQEQMPSKIKTLIQRPFQRSVVKQSAERNQGTTAAIAVFQGSSAT